MSAEEVVKTLIHVMNPHDNGGESVSMSVKFWKDKKYSHVFMTQDITLNSYNNASTIHLGFAFSPESLRKLADDIEATLIEVQK